MWLVDQSRQRAQSMLATCITQLAKLKMLSEARAGRYLRCASNRGEAWC